MAYVEHGRCHLHGGGGEQLGWWRRRTTLVHARANRTPPGLQRGEQLRRDAVVDERRRIHGPGGLWQVYQTGTFEGVHQTGTVDGVHQTGTVDGVHQTGFRRVYGRRASQERVAGQNKS